MKVSIAVLAVAATAQEKKVPPRRPEQRLNRLVQFSAEWLNDNVNDPEMTKKSERRISLWSTKFASNAARMLKAFNRPHCGFFDPNLPFGGPDNNPELRPGGRPRNRRQVAPAAESGEYEGDDGSLLRYDKNNPMLGIKQITTGFRKWAQRYINECSGQRKNKYQVQRMARWFKTLGQFYVEIQKKNL